MGGAPKINAKLRRWREGRGLKMEDAAALVVVDGEPCTKSTWHGWETAGKVPKPAWMIPLCAVTGLEPNDFYPRPDGAAAKRGGEPGGTTGGAGPKPKAGNGQPPPQMAFAL